MWLNILEKSFLILLVIVTLEKTSWQTTAQAQKIDLLAEQPKLTTLDQLYVQQSPLKDTQSEMSGEKCDFQANLSQKATEPLVLLTINVEGQPVEIQVEGSTVFSRDDLMNSEELKETLAAIEGQNLKIEEFQQEYDKLIKDITLLYLNRGYLTSQAKPEIPIDLSNGLAKIFVVEGGLESLEIKGRRRLKLSYICNRVGLGVETPLNVIRLEEQLRLLQLNPLFEDVKGDLAETGTEGRSKLSVIVNESASFHSDFSADNFSPPSLGSERLGITLDYRNLTGFGDEISAAYYNTTTGGADLVDLLYWIPLNPMEGTLQIRATLNWTKITQSPLDELNITGNNKIYEINYRQPLVRTLREEFALSIGFRYQDGQTLGINRPDLFGSSRTSVFQFSQDYLNRDASGIWFVRSLMNFGTGLLDATDNDSSIPDGQFFSWVGQLQRLQRINDNNLLIIQGELQLTPDSLLPEYLFYIGGGQSVRGYSTNARSADNGFHLSIEDRITLLSEKPGAYRLQIAPFVDLGYVWNSAGDLTQLPPQTFLIGAGLGLIWEPIENLRFRVDYGYPFINLEDRGNNLQDDGFYFQVNYHL